MNHNDELANVIDRLDRLGVILRPAPKINHPTWIHLSTINDDPAIPGPITLRRIADLLDQAAHLLEAAQRE